MDTTSTTSTERPLFPILPPTGLDNAAGLAWVQPIPFASTGRYAVSGSREMASTGIAALEALPEYLDRLTAIDAAEGAEGSSEVAEIQLWENMPVTALIISDLGFTSHHVWAGDRWVEYVY